MLHGQRTILFIDEIHRYSKTQQDALLPHVENGTIILMGATTENPSFQVIPALLSRLLLVRLNPLSRSHIITLIKRGVIYLGKPFEKLVITLDAISFIADYAGGDGRSALNLLETACKCARVLPVTWEDQKNRDDQNKEDQDKTIKQDNSNQPAFEKQIDVPLLEQLAQQNRLNYDQQGDAHYDHASAYQKSMRGGDASAAIYWLAKMLVAGEDPRFIARRLMVTASEDVGLADPQAFQLAVAAAQAAEKLGLPEARIPLAMATIYTANAAKNNAAIVAIDAAMADIRHHGHVYPVPMHLRDAHYSGASSYGHGEGYLYTHDHPEATQTFLPEALQGKRYI
jgi:putative ATPase